MGVNSKYKDSVFSFIFNNPDTLRELYSALKGVSLPPDLPVTINTLQNVLFMELINDISFQIGGKLVVLIEHQSTINPNMALRLLMYIARVYEKIIGDRGIYTTQLIPIPRPEFFVLYNGTAPYPDEQVLRLSDAFEKPDIPGLSEKAVLELEVRVLNINEGRNGAIAQRCRKLAEYSAFIGKVRSFEKELKDKEAAMEAAIRYCREHDILKEFLEQNGAEVMNMLITEWNTEEAKDVWYEEGMERGREEGLERGMERGREEGLGKGIETATANIARNALAQGASPDFIQKITGLSTETIAQL
ncbi:MAG: Rpn family recombination-promoting nuclease/putative transposase [Spirochaetaceae bacterium]|jgi:predicted transposase/invertase (TIGR01784 family)|nr:Rpn family recombination-promoting nuclease/putative transposase [Spirochaetaceae bacterium]